MLNGQRTSLVKQTTGSNFINVQIVFQPPAVFRRQIAGPVYLQTLTDKTLTNRPSNQICNFNLQHTFGANGGILTADFALGHFSRDYSNNLITETIISEEPADGLIRLFTQMPTTIDILAFIVDYSRSILGSWKNETSLKSSSVHSVNNMTLSSGVGGELKIDPQLSNHFQYSELVNAVYASLSGKIFDKTEIQMGLRAEHTHSTDKRITLDQKVTRDYLDLFPSLFISTDLSVIHNLAFSYSYRIDRANDQSLNPARAYLDPFAFSRGNPS